MRQKSSIQYTICYELREAFVQQWTITADETEVSTMIRLQSLLSERYAQPWNRRLSRYFNIRTHSQL